MSAPATPAPVVSRRFLALSLATALIGVLSYCAADQKPLLAAVALAAGAASAWMTLGRAPAGLRGLPRWAVNVLVLAATANAALAVSSRANPLVSDLSDYLTLVLLTKLLDRRRPRDEAQVLGLSMFVVIGAVLTSNSFLLGLALAAYTPMALGAVVWFQVYTGRRSMAELASGLRPRDGWGGGAGRRLAALAAVSGLAVMGLALTAFVGTPRTLASQAMGGWGQGAAGAQADFRPDIELGQVGLLSASEDAVMDVAVADAAGAPLAAPPAIIYLRGSVLEDYDPVHGRWAAPRGRRGTGRFVSREELPAGEVLALHAAGREGPWAQAALRYTINVHRQPAGRWPLHAPWRTLAVSSPNVVKIGRTAASVLERTEGAAGRLTYTAVAGPDPGDPGAAADRVPRAAAAAGPEVTERIRALAESVLREAEVPITLAEREAGDARRAAQTLAQHLRTRYAYTLEMVAPVPGQDPIEMFLFDTRRGHCEYFAAALTAMLRSVGIGARIATGYAAGEYNPIVGAYVVRRSDAHAWVEVRVQDEPARWEVFDPTPPGQLAHSQRAAGESMFAQLIARVRQTYEAAELRWIQSVVAFDQSPAGNYDLFAAGEGARRRVRGLTRFVDGLVERVVGDAETPISARDRWLRWVAGVAVLAVLAAVSVAGLLLGVRALLRHLRHGAGAARRAAWPRRATPVYLADLLKALEPGSATGGRPAGVHPLAFARARAAALGDQAGEAIDVVYLAYRERFGGQPATRAEAREAGRRVRAIRTALRGRTGSVPMGR